MRPARFRGVALLTAVVVAGHAWLVQQAVPGPAGEPLAASAPGKAFPAMSRPSAALVEARWIDAPHRSSTSQSAERPGSSVAAAARAGRLKTTTTTTTGRARSLADIGTQLPASGFEVVSSTTVASILQNPEVIRVKSVPTTALLPAAALSTPDHDATRRDVTQRESAAAEPSERVAQAVAGPSAESSEVLPEPAEVVDVPTYRTRPPASMHLSYQLRRGMITGTGDFDWKSDGGSYEMRLDGKVAGFSVLSWVSKGGFDAAGLAPVRYTDQRRNKQTLAANFQRGQGVITYSQPQTEHPLVAGSQDRLSWMIQLPSILAADPSLGKAGSHVAMFVTGARGDADVWSFRVVAHEPVSTPGGTVDAIHMLREARKPHDTQVDVWLDPKRGYLPVHAQMANEGGGDAFELSLR